MTNAIIFVIVSKVTKMFDQTEMCSAPKYGAVGQRIENAIKKGEIMKAIDVVFNTGNQPEVQRLLIEAAKKRIDELANENPREAIEMIFVIKEKFPKNDLVGYFVDRIVGN